MMEAIEIVMAVDANYVRQLGVALASISVNTGAPCRVHVLHDGVSADDRERVERSLRDGIQLEWIDARRAGDGMGLPVGKPRATYLRLLFTDLLPDELERVIYLDADVMVLGSLTDLWESDIDGVVGAVRDAYRPWMVRNTTFQWRAVGVLPDAPFFNSGVMLTDLRRWRTGDVGARALELVRAESSMWDQCALNVVLDGGWTPLHPKWNVQSYHLTGDECLAYATEGRDRLDRALSEPAIVHFTGGSFNRPWQAPCSNPRRDEWLAYLDRTAWRGWRPDPAPVVSRAWGRAQRALRVLRNGGAADLRT
jgi:lipopolysaccharide biosynthesis glycosyltransferase